MRQYYVAKAMGGGLLGTLLQTIMVYGVAPMIAGQSMDVAAITGAMGLEDPRAFKSLERAASAPP